MPPDTTVADAPAAPTSSLPEGVRVGDERLVCLTEAAGSKAQNLMAREQSGPYLRVAVSGGGCSGLSYKLKFATEPKRGDILVHTGGIPVVVDSRSALYLRGTHLDYSDSLVSGGFKFRNPNAKGTCSCGDSFAV